MTYSIVVARSAAKSLRAIDPGERSRILAAIEALADDPRPHGAIRIVGGEGELRIRVGDDRVIYDVVDDRIEVLVLAIGHRSAIYREPERQREPSAARAAMPTIAVYVG